MVLEPPAAEDWTVGMLRVGEELDWMGDMVVVVVEVVVV